MSAEAEQELRVLIVDDEPPARARLQALLGEDPRVQVVGECANGHAAVASIVRLKPDLVLLDIEMPELDGFGVVDAVGPANMPAVVFVTAYDRYALQAFDVCALDYVLKPFDGTRLTRALDRACDQQAAREALATRLEHLLETPWSPGPGERLAFRSGGRVHRVRPRQIEWVRARGNYLELHTDTDTLLARGTLAGLLERLGPGFLRIHRSLLVQAEQVVRCQHVEGGDYRILLASGTELGSGRRYRDEVRRLLP